MLVFALSGCGGGASGPAASPPVTNDSPAPQRSLVAQVGEKIFNDPHLSGSTRMSCATCHDPRFAHGPANNLPVQPGGVFEDQFGLRAAPSLRYLDRSPAFAMLAGHADTASGGFTWDGRADTLAAQARLPFFNVREMANKDQAQLIRNIRAATYGALFAQAFGVQDDATALLQVQQALQAFQLEDAAFHPYDSKYDLFLAGKARLSNAEQRGLQVFNDPARGNCAACHPATGTDGQPPLFTNFGYAALGVPRNKDIPDNADPQYFDLGLCGPTRTDVQQDAACGLFKTPTLRNVAQRPVLFHNGVMRDLAQAVRFYATRDTQPALWYPLVGGVVQKFDDLPAKYQPNLTRRAPLDGRAPGSAPAMTEREVLDVVCFLQALSDHYQAGSAPAAGCGD